MFSYFTRPKGPCVKANGALRPVTRSNIFFIFLLGMEIMFIFLPIDRRTRR